MIIEIDVRERNLIQLLRTMEILENVNIVEKQLPIGDIIIKTDDEQEVLIIERKTPRDLIASIKDGRYKEQSLRLNSCDLHNHHIFYLIEGNIEYVEEKWKQTIRSAIFSLNYYKGYSIWNTHSIMGTVEWICDIIQKMKKENSQCGFYMSTRENENQTYTSCIKRNKSENINIENIHQIMLSQIPGVSAKVSEIIMNEYRTLFHLKESMKENNKCLNNLTYTLSNGQVRHINKKSIDNIFLFLHDNF